MKDPVDVIAEALESFVITHSTERPIGKGLAAYIHNALFRAGLVISQGWQPIASAPKGGGAEFVTDPKWVEPPQILLLFNDGKVSVGYWDWYYAEGGSGYRDGHAWIEPCSGEQLNLHYDLPTNWMPLHALPTAKPASKEPRSHADDDLRELEPVRRGP